ncbi:hypothetical protein ABZX74_15470 [Streptomyces olivaceoviridis]|uniref:hypothetical protein n=1 Tax=Streptomyces olivaceoviridis TaxID=1921 RepID=UPI0033BB7C4C
MPDLHGWISQQIDGMEALARAGKRGWWEPWVLRRCEADRRILARHTLDPDVHYEPACKGCGTYGDMELPETDNLNECPELLDLAYAHGLTPEILASLDCPEPPPAPPRPEPTAVNLSAYMRLWTAQPTSSVPPALRGPNWKARP